MIEDGIESKWPETTYTVFASLGSLPGKKRQHVLQPRRLVARARGRRLESVYGDGQSFARRFRNLGEAREDLVAPAADAAPWIVPG